MDAFMIGLVALAAGAIVWPYVARRNAVLAGWGSAMVPLAMCAWLLWQVPNAGADILARWSHEWIPSLGVRLDFLLDGVGLLLALLVSGIGSLILIYGGGYLKKSAQAAPFFCYIHLFMLAMLGMASADHFIAFFVFWELTSLASYLLIGLNHSNEEARKSALRALLVTGTGGLALLAGLVLLGNTTGVFHFSELKDQASFLATHSNSVAILVLILAGAFTKSAQFPFHFWLPGAMVAPTPVSAYLHSATMVKAGVFLLAKVYVAFGQSALWHDTLMIVGVLTMLFASLLALAQTDLKRLLAYSTMSALGTLVLLIGMGTLQAIQAAMVFLVVHALYKASLFMVAGIVDKTTGTRDITLLHGLGKKFPLVAFAAVLAAFSMSGIPPFIGFIGKELLYEAQVSVSRFALWITIAGFAANAVNVAVALKVGFAPFRSRGSAPALKYDKIGPGLWIGPLLLALIGALIGVFPDLLGKNLLTAAVRDITNQDYHAHLKLWHGFNLLLLLSAVTVVFGLALFILRNKVRPVVYNLLERAPAKANETFDQLLASVLDFAGQATLRIQHGNLRGYFVILLLSLTALIGWALVSIGSWGEFSATPVRLIPASICVVLAIASLVAVRAKERLTAIMSLGVVGFGIAMLFGLFGAPDLALTQVLVETLTLALFAFILRPLPLIKNRSSRTRRGADALIAVAAGGAVTLAMLAVLMGAKPDFISTEMVARSVPEAFGNNIVNVILVDFRAMDTLGEITVLTIASLGVAGLLLGLGRHNPAAENAVATPIYRSSIKVIMPLLVLISVVLLLRGHNVPGGGFIGGLLAGSALILKRLALGEQAARLTRGPFLLLGGGLLLGVLSIVPSVLAQAPLMQAQWFGSLWIPLVGKVKFGSPFIFDLGVFFVVIGTCQLILSRVLQSSEIDLPSGTQSSISPVGPSASTGGDSNN